MMDNDAMREAFEKQLQNTGSPCVEAIVPASEIIKAGSTPITPIYTATDAP
jgi:hypothetical protein